MHSMYSATSDQDYQAQFQPSHNTEAARRRASYLLTDLTEALESGDADRVEAARATIDAADQAEDVAIITREDVEAAERAASTGPRFTSAGEFEAYMEGVD